MTLAERLSQVELRIANACVAAGRDRSEVELIVVSKNHPAQLVLDLFSLGQRAFGENKDQEASIKAQQVAEVLPGEKIDWHFVGQLQSNKVKSVIQYAAFIHSLDRRSLLDELVKQLAKSDGRIINVFIELNLTDDQNRGGIKPENLLEFAELVLEKPQLNLMGVMAVGSLDGEAERDFELTALASQKLHQIAPEARFISAGMSGDFEQAIQYGATHIRVGTAITGPRQ